MQFLHLLRHYPFIRIIIPFITGILTGIHFMLSETFMVIMLLILSGTLIFVHFYNSAFGLRWLYGILFNVVFIVSGMAFANINVHKNKDVLRYSNTEAIIQAEVIKPVVEKEKSIGTLLRVNIIMSGSVIKERFRVTAYFEKDDRSKKLRVGDVILAKTYLKEIPGPTNPHEFNYKKRMQWKNVCLTTYIKSSSWEKTDFKNSPFAIAAAIREKLFEIYGKCGIRGDELAVLSALTLGNKDQLSDEITQYYAASGAMHILAVSGLHVGIIYILTSRLLFFLRRNRWGKIPCTIIIILCLWSFAAIAGFSPSVSRAAFMFMVIQIGKTLKKPPEIYNNIAFSAFVLLLFNPFQIADVGFQLSFLAVTGIVYFQPKIYNLLYIRNRAPDYLWQLVSVSLAAQLATAPLTIGYFHYFPTLFWLTNIFVIPLAAIIIYGAVLLVILHYMQLPYLFFGKILNFILTVQNYLIFKIQGVSFSMIENIDISAVQVALYFLILIAFTLYLIKKKGKWLICSLSFSLTFLLLHLLHIIKIENQCQMVVFNITNKTVISLVDGRTAVFITDLEQKEDLAEHFSIKNFIVKNGIKQIENYNFKCQADRLSLKNMYVFNAKNSIYFVNGRFTGVLHYHHVGENTLPPTPLKVNCIVLANNVINDPGHIEARYIADWLVVDPSNNRRFYKGWHAHETDSSFKVHLVAGAGAFRLNVIEFLKSAS
ncbi:MAG: ComEC family competence protein [Bacteroidales bacterium]|nr:ComEC family competence protein [Bacteroidales bacterium]